LFLAGLGYQVLWLAFDVLMLAPFTNPEDFDPQWGPILLFAFITNTAGLGSLISGVMLMRNKRKYWWLALVAASIHFVLFTFWEGGFYKDMTEFIRDNYVDEFEMDLLIMSGFHFIVWAVALGGSIIGVVYNRNTIINTKK
jgi:hypothetical protein